ncbi:glycosyltransferase [Cytobacillus sp. BC1816]|uniref:glycosyltransferase n=1 Tax=Cytobacillus sp. BC1816 TaxID=3440154 RepID=UPI003F50F569
MKSVLVYYPFALSENPNSGSKLRPLEMKNAFHAWGMENDVNIIVISGTSEQREQQFNELVSSGKLENLWFCYMENQTIPLWLTDPGHKPKRPFVDRKVLRYLKGKSVPIGVFYRDVYWKFDELYSLKGLKKTIMQAIYRKEEKFYEKYCDVIFLPSDAMGEYVDIAKRKIALPPGGKAKSIAKKVRSDGRSQGIYVGGINNEDYGLFLLLDALEIANSQKRICDLTVVCREEEFANLPDKKKNKFAELDVQVKHLSGEPLNELYKEMDYAFIPRYRSTYNDFSVPVKLVEYLSNELPVIATYCKAQKEIIEKDGYGLICADNAKDMSKAIQSMAVDTEKFRYNIQQSFVEEHSWKARVKKVKSALLKEEL